MPKVITYRELKNDSDEILRRVEEGDSYVITHRGRPVALLSPLTHSLPSLHLASPQRRFVNFASVKREESTQAVLDELRSE